MLCEIVVTRRVIGRLYSLLQIVLILLADGPANSFVSLLSAVVNLMKNAYLEELLETYILCFF
jgi:hypothetical protein